MTMPALRELQGKYNAVVAENERLYHDLRAEQVQHERYRAAYERVRGDVEKDQATLRELYAQMEPESGSHVTAASRPAEDDVDAGGPSATRPTKTDAAAAVSSSDADRIYSLERDCAYLQAKVESLHLALRDYEGNSSFLEKKSNAVEGNNSVGESRVNAAASAEAERDRRRRAEEQLTRCHATLRSLRDDAAQKEAFYYQQLTALQEQNTALLEDLDRWVTGEQNTLLATTFASRLDGGSASAGAASPAAVAASSLQASPLPPVDSKQATQDDNVDAEMLRQMQQYLKDQEEVLALKDKSIAQLEARVQELERNSESSASAKSSLAVPVKELLAVRREATVARACVDRFVSSRRSDAHTDASFSALRAASLSASSTDVPTESVLRDVHAVLHYTVAALEIEKGSTPLRQPPLTVVQPSAASSYRSGETLTEAAQQLAKLMRRHMHQ